MNEAPGTTFSGLEEVGQVTVLFGSSTFVNGSWFDLNSTRRLHQGVYNGGGGHGDGDAFGAALAAGDFDFDGYDDAVIGHPGEDILVGGEHRGGFSVLTGSPANPHGPGRSFRFFGAGYAGVPLPAADERRPGFLSTVERRPPTLPMISRVLSARSRFDPIVLGSALTLSVLGVLFVASATAGGNSPDLATRQGIWVAVGVGLGLTQGTAAGLAVGAVIVLAVTWHNSRSQSTLDDSDF